MVDQLKPSFRQQLLERYILDVPASGYIKLKAFLSHREFAIQKKNCSEDGEKVV
jgi:hypothetical protein